MIYSFQTFPSGNGQNVAIMPLNMSLTRLWQPYITELSSKTPTNCCFGEISLPTQELCVCVFGLISAFVCQCVCVFAAFAEIPPSQLRSQTHTHTASLCPGLPLLCVPHWWRHTWAGRHRCHRPGGGCGCMAAAGEQSWHTPSAKHRCIHTD